MGGFTTRLGGTSASPYDSLNLGLHVSDDPGRVHANRLLFAAAAGVAVDSLVFAEQVHGSGVAVVRAPVPQAVAGVDALVTSTPGLGLVVLSADCLGVLLVDPSAGVAAAVHAGRKGLVSGVLQATLAVMGELGATAAGSSAVLGPAACGRCYELPAELADEVEAAVPGARSSTWQETAAVDLTAGATRVLRSSGVRAVRAVGGCTIEQPGMLFSYRRSGRTGRHAAFVRLT